MGCRLLACSQGSSTSAHACCWPSWLQATLMHWFTGSGQSSGGSDAWRWRMGRHIGVQDSLPLPSPWAPALLGPMTTCAASRSGTGGGLASCRARATATPRACSRDARPAAHLFLVAQDTGQDGRSDVCQPPQLCQQAVWWVQADGVGWREGRLQAPLSGCARTVFAPWRWPECVMQRR